MTRDDLIVASYWVLFICAPAVVTWALFDFSHDDRAIAAAVFLILAVLADHGLRIWGRLWGAGNGARAAATRTTPRPRADDEEGDVADDPFLSAVDADLGSVDRLNDHKLGVALALLVAAAYGYHRSGVKSPWIDALGVAALLGVIGFVILRAAQQKRRVAVQHGLRCKRCGHIPSAHMVMSAAMSERCAKCGAPLEARRP